MRRLLAPIAFLSFMIGTPALAAWWTDANGDGSVDWNPSPGVDYYAPSGPDVSIADGGTGQSTALAGFNALSPLTTRGDLITRDATNNVRLGIGGNGTCLTSNGTDASWGSCGAGGGAPTDATYITQTANATLSAEQAMGTLGTGLVKNTTTTGVQSIYAGTSCTNTFPRSLDASGAATCAAVADADLASSYSGVGACSANQWASTLNDNAAPSCTQPAFSNLSGAATDAQVPDSITISLAALATALAANGANCSGNNFALGVDASGVGECAQPAFSNLSGSATIAQGGTGQGTALAAFNALSPLTTRGDLITRDASNNVRLAVGGNGTCLTSNGTDAAWGSCGGGSANGTLVTVDFGTGAASASVVVTGQSWVTSTSWITCSPTAFATTDKSEGFDDWGTEKMAYEVYSRSAGTGFTVRMRPQMGAAFGKYVLSCTGGG